MDTCIIRKNVDWSLFKDGFAIPYDYQDFFQNNSNLKTRPGEGKNIFLVIDGIAYPVELRNLPINKKKYPEHVPVIQIRYKASDEIAGVFRRIFWRSWEDMSKQKNYYSGKKRVRASVIEGFELYTTNDPYSFRLECHSEK